MPGRVTIQDIADALGLSRNTVSKAINNTGVLAESTRNRVLQKAVEMGYKQFSYVTFMENGKSAPIQASLSLPKSEDVPDAAAEYLPEEGSVPQVIAMLYNGPMGSSHFATTMVDKLHLELSLLGYELVMYRIGQKHLKTLTLPAPITRESVGGIICVEMFNREYSDMVCDCGIPVLFVDSPVSPCNITLRADRLLMENRSNIYLFIQEMARRGKKRIGFIGDPYHCLSFYERYMGFHEALYMAGIPFSPEYCILSSPDFGVPATEEYRDDLVNRIQSMQELPDVFLCANDFVALDVMQALERLGIAIPDRVCLCGFDDSSESRLVTPRLTTIHIHSQIMGVTAVQLLMSRIAEPTLNYRTVYTETSLIYRASTGD